MFPPHKILSTTSNVSHILTETENQNILCPSYKKEWHSAIWSHMLKFVND